MNKPTEVIAYRNPWEHWYWNNLSEFWGIVALVAIALYLIFWLPVFVSYKKDTVNVRNGWEAFVLTLFWPITLPITMNR